MLGIRGSAGGDERVVEGEFSDGNVYSRQSAEALSESADLESGTTDDIQYRPSSAEQRPRSAQSIQHSIQYNVDPQRPSSTGSNQHRPSSANSQTQIHENMNSRSQQRPSSAHSYYTSGAGNSSTHFNSNQQYIHNANINQQRPSSVQSYRSDTSGQRPSSANSYRSQSSQNRPSSTNNQQRPSSANSFRNHESGVENTAFQSNSDLSFDIPARPVLTNENSNASGLSLGSLNQTSQSKLMNVDVDNQSYTLQNGVKSGSNENVINGGDANGHSSNSMITFSEVKETRRRRQKYSVNIESKQEESTASAIPTMQHENNKYQFATPVKQSGIVKSAFTPDSTLMSSPSSETTRAKSIRFAETNEIRTYTPSPDEFEINPAEGFNHSIGCGVKVRNFFASSVIPFTYGATSSLTTLFLFFELVIRYEHKAEIAGLYLMGSYFCRVLFNSISRYAPKSFIFLGSVLAFIGFVAIFISQTPEFLNLNNSLDFEDDGLALFLVGSILTSSNENVGAIQMLVREQHLYDIKMMGSQLRTNFFMAKLARVCSFIGAGFLYHYFGAHGVAALGAGLVSLQLMILIIFFILDVFRVPNVVENKSRDQFVGNLPSKPSFSMNCSIRAARGRRRLFKSAMSHMNRTLAKYYPSELPPSDVRYIIPICAAARNISSTIIWVSAPVILANDFKANFISVGAILAIGSAFDFLTAVVATTTYWGMKKKDKTQLVIYVCMGGITFSSALTIAPNFYSFCCGFFFYSIFNSLLRFALAEIQGASINITESFAAQITRRTCLAGSLYCLPILYNIHPRLPTVVSAWFALLLSIILAFVLLCCKKSSEIKKLDDDVERRASRLDSKRMRMSKRPERNLTYSQQLMLSRLIKGKDVYL